MRICILFCLVVSVCGMGDDDDTTIYTSAPSGEFIRGGPHWNIGCLLFLLCLSGTKLGPMSMGFVVHGTLMDSSWRSRPTTQTVSGSEMELCIDYKPDPRCRRINCIGEEYECINGRCYCASGFIPNHFQNQCIRCPGLGDKCYGMCCDKSGNVSLHCWKGICQPCTDSEGNWTCRESLDHILLVSSAQVVMGAALILGIIATFILLYKLCATPDLRNSSQRTGGDGRLSIGSLQLYIEERLRDAPPRYSRTPAAGSATYPALAYLNAGFIHDSSVPPPAYTEAKVEENQNTTVHI